MPTVGSVVTVFVEGRHDFQRKATVLAVRGDEMRVRWHYNLPDEWVPVGWL